MRVHHIIHYRRLVTRIRLVKCAYILLVAQLFLCVFLHGATKEISVTYIEKQSLQATVFVVKPTVCYNMPCTFFVTSDKWNLQDCVLASLQISSFQQRHFWRNSAAITNLPFRWMHTNPLGNVGLGLLRLDVSSEKELDRSLASFKQQFGGILQWIDHGIYQVAVIPLVCRSLLDIFIIILL